MSQGSDVPGGPPDGTFAFRIVKGDRVLIDWNGRQVTVVAGARGARLAAQLLHAAAAEQQALLARATGNFKHGNERRSEL